MDNENRPPSNSDPGLRRMLKWVAIAFIATVAFAILVVEITLRWLNQ
jgi:hypothetical protein